MIRRAENRDGESWWLLISQIEHARLAGRIAAQWGNAGGNTAENDAVPGLPLAARLGRAVAGHDDGWHRWEERPRLNADGEPCDFREMPADEATAIWAESVAACAAGPPSAAAALRRMRESGTDAGDRGIAALLDAVTSARGFVVGADLLEASEQPDADRPDAALNRLESAGLLVRAENPLRPDLWRIDLPPGGRDPLGGLWVGGHFTALAERTRDGAETDADRTAAERFLAEQTGLRAAWESDALREFAGDDLSRLIATGTRYVRFFDALSLTLCCGEQPGPWRATLADGRGFRFTPRSPPEITVDPWPLRVDALELTAEAVAIPAAPLAGDGELLAAIAAGERVAPRWVLVP